MSSSRRTDPQARRRLGGVVAGLLVTVLAGCSWMPGAGPLSPGPSTTASPQTPTASLPPLAEVASVTSPEQVSRPVDGFRLSAGQVLALAAAEERMANACRTGLGLPPDFAYVPEQVSFYAGLAASEASNSPLWGLFDTAPEATYLPQRPQGPTLYGGSGDKAASSECFRASALKMPHGQSFVFQVRTIDWPAQGPASPALDPRWAEAVGAWQRCLVAHGRPASLGPAELARQLGQQPSPGNRSMAAVDVACKVETNLVGVGAALQAAYDEQYLTAHGDELRAWKGEIDEFLTRS